MAWLASLVAGGCDASGQPASRPGDARDRLVRKVDGSQEAAIEASVTSDELQEVVFTGSGAGTDQGKVLVFSRDATRLIAEHHVPNRSPFPIAGVIPGESGAEFCQSMWVNPRHVRVFVRDGRRFLAYASRGVWSPAALVVLEAVEGHLVTRVELWNEGHFQVVALHGRWLAFLASRRSEMEPGKHDRSLGVLDLTQIPGGDDGRPLIIDTSGPAPTIPAGVQYHVAPADIVIGGGLYTIEMVDGVFRCGPGTGLTYLMDPEARTLRMETDTHYARLFEGLRGRPTDVTLEEHVRSLEQGIRTK